MEKNQIIGFALIFVILVGWSIMSAPSEEEIQQAKEKQRLEQLAQQEAEQEAIPASSEVAPATNITALPDSLQVAQQAGQFGVFAPSSVGMSQESTLENDVLSLTFDSKGGRITSAVLKDHVQVITEENQKIVGEEVVKLLEDAKNRWNYVLNLGNLTINSQDLYFTPEVRGNKITYTAKTSTGGYIQQIYTLQEDEYKLDYDVTISGLANQLDRNEPILLEIDNYLSRLERNDEYERRFSTVYFKPEGKDSDYCNCARDATEDKSDKRIEWVSFSNQFFNTSLVAQSQPFDGLLAQTEMYDDANEDLKKTSARLKIPYQGSQSETINMSLFIGPNDYNMLASYDKDLQEIIPFGRSLFGSINRHLIRPFFNFLLGFMNSKGLVIIVLIFIVKMVFYPLTYKMLHSQAKMGVLKPMLAGLKEKFKDDAQKQQMETMKVYREYGVSPFSGCLPMFVQMPIWYALFRFFPASITFRQEPFLWANDLSSYDSVINLPFTIPGMGSHLSLFTILWAITTVVYTFYNTRHMDMNANPAMKYVQYLMPIMFFVFFNKYASGLTCYMFFSQLITVAQTIITKKFVFDDEKLLAELNKNKDKPKKKGGFMQKLQEAQEKQAKVHAMRAEQARKASKKKKK